MRSSTYPAAASMVCAVVAVPADRAAQLPGAAKWQPFNQGLLIEVPATR